MIALILPVAIAAASVLFTLFVSGGLPYMLAFVDLPSLVLVPVTAWLCAAAGFGWKRSFAAWKAPLDPGADAAALRSSLAWTGALAGWIAAFAALGLFMGLVLILANLGDASKLGRNLAVAVLVSVYAAVSMLVLVMPARTIAARRLADLA